MSFSNTLNQTYIRSTASDILSFGTAATERATIQANGTVRIGTTTTPGGALGSQLVVGGTYEGRFAIRVYTSDELSVVAATVSDTVPTLLADGPAVISFNLTVGGSPSIRLYNGTNYVAIGNVSDAPSAPLHVNTTEVPAFKIGGGSTNAAQYMTFVRSGANAFIGLSSNTGAGLVSSGLNNSLAITTEDATPLQFGVNSAAEITIAADGKVGIARNDPATTLHISGDLTIDTLVPTSQPDAVMLAVNAGSAYVQKTSATYADFENQPNWSTIGQPDVRNYEDDTQYDALTNGQTIFDRPSETLSTGDKRLKIGRAHV